jgi:hypothetical protein
MKAYIVSNSDYGTENIDGIYYLITEEGECLASHWCSSRLYAKGDLYTRRPERVAEFTNRFGEFEVDYLGCDDMTMGKLIELNHKFAEEHGID